VWIEDVDPYEEAPVFFEAEQVEWVDDVVDTRKRLLWCRSNHGGCGSSRGSPDSELIRVSLK
jgi:hypothetical protein